MDIFDDLSTDVVEYASLLGQVGVALCYHCAKLLQALLRSLDLVLQVGRISYTCFCPVADELIDVNVLDWADSYVSYRLSKQ